MSGNFLKRLIFNFTTNLVYFSVIQTKMIINQNTGQADRPFRILWKDTIIIFNPSKLKWIREMTATNSNLKDYSGRLSSSS